MKKLSKISESIWSDIQDRSSGEITRKEDNVNNMDMESFWLYIIKNYKERVRTLDKDHFCKDYDMDIVVDPSEDIVIFGSYVKDELVRIMVVLKTKAKDTTVKKIIDTSPDNFRWIRINSDKLELALNDGEVTNQTFVNLIEFFLNNQQVFESIWSDIQDRSTGETVRQEDNVDFLEPDDFIAYIRKIYRIDNTPYDIVNRTNGLAGTGASNIFIPICTAGTKNIKIGAIYFDYNNGEVYTHSSIKKYIPELWAKLDQDFDLWIDPNYQSFTNINPKDKSRKVNNSYVLELLNYICDNLDDNVTPCLFRRTNESIWSDIQDRSNGDVIRDEDKFNPDYVDFGPETTVYWAIDNLEIDGEVKFYFDDVKDYNNNGWRLPTIDEVNQLKWNVRISWKEGCKHLEFDDGNELRLKTNGSGGFHMWTKEINTKFPSSAYAYGFDNSYIFDVNNFNKSINRLFVFLVKDKKVTESIWSDIQDRSSGETIRKEDEITNIKDLVPVDMGGSVLWADDDLSLKDGDCYFTFDEVFELVKNSDWRLPTLEEVAELDDIYKKGSFWENDDGFVFDGFPHQLVFFKKGLIYTSASDKPIDKDYYYCWTSTLFLNNNRFANIFTFNNGKPCHTPLNDQHNVNHSVTQDITNGKLCVRLVKNK